MLSLVCCKPFIRRNSCGGEWVIGFVPKGMKRGHIAWVGKISKIVPLEEYARQFPDRRDAQYWKRDSTGRNALIFDPFWYWGGFGIRAPEDIAELAHYHVGQSTKNSSPQKIARLSRWAQSVAPSGIHGSPRDEQNIVAIVRKVANCHALSVRRKSFSRRTTTCRPPL
jgi:hypothetical protein